MRYLIYKITNLNNRKYYIGRHSTNDVNDSYMGSGIGIKNAINKYGLENFKKEIIAQTNSAEKLWRLEKKIINKDVVKDKMSYNNAFGGKHYLDGLKKYDFKKFIKHQREAGRKGGPAAYKLKTKEQKRQWHALGGSKSSKLRSSKFRYEIITSKNQKYIVNGWEFKKICKDNKWNHNTLSWKKSLGKQISRGSLKGFQVNMLQGVK